MRTVSIVSVLFLAATTAFAVPPGVDLTAADPVISALPQLGSSTPCVDGDAGGYPCENVDLLAHLTLPEMDCGEGNDIWGWTDPLDGTEYALLGCNTGTAFVDLSDPTDPIYLGQLESATSSSAWRDIKVYEDHAFVVSDNNGPHGLQVFDLTELREVTDPPVTFEEVARLETFGPAHNVAINEDTGYAYVVGSNICSAGLYFVDIQNPASPQGAGCFSGDGYTHDVQCVTYQGPDTDHTDDEICFASNEDTLTVVDVTDKSNPIQLAREGYSGVGYTHQGWLTEDHRFFLLDDECDEPLNHNCFETQPGHNTRTRIWDVSDLDAPEIIGIYDATTPSRDHNQYVKGNFVYQSNYTAGLRILDLSAVADGELTEVGYFDTYPDGDPVRFWGTWSNYPFFDSGIVIVSAIGAGGGPGGLFVLQPNLANVDPAITVSDAAVEEGDAGVVEIEFPVALSKAVDETVTVDFETEDGTAVAGVDYVAASGTVTFDPGQVSTTIPVTILPNTELQDDRTFLLHLSNPVGATISQGTATGTIIDDDDTVPSLSVNDPSVDEGDGESVDLTFVVNLSFSIGEAVSFDYTTADGTAIAGEDYEPVSGTATLQPGETQFSIDVPVIGNDVPQEDRTLSLQISDSINATIGDPVGTGTIVEDDEIVAETMIPSSGAAAGGDVIGINGANFLPEVEVEFGETSALAVEYVSPTHIEATTPTLAAGELFDLHVIYGEHEHLGEPREQLHLQHIRYLSDFDDVPRDHAFHDFVEILRRSDVSGGCGGGQFCVGDTVSRGQMAVFLLKGAFGGTYQPPACTGMFEDVPCSTPFAAWVEDLSNRGITEGCQISPARFCPAAEVSRGQMAVFLMRALEGGDYVPPPCDGVFEDVPCSSPFAGWIEDLVSREVTSGCSADPARYCPTDGVGRGQMAAFLVRTFNIPFLW